MEFVRGEMILGSKIEDNLFRLFVKNAENAYLSFEGNLLTWIEKQQTLGVSREDIVKRLDEDLNSGQGIFKNLTSEVDRLLMEGLNENFQVASNEPMVQTKAMVKQQLDPAAEHCDTCLHYAGLPAMEIGEFVSQYGYPGSQKPVGDYCSLEISVCKCTLVIVGEE